MMRRRTISDWFFLLTVAVPMTAAAFLLCLLGLLGILDLFGAETVGGPLWAVFLGAAVGFLGLVFLFRVMILVAGVIALLMLTLRRTAQGTAMLVMRAISRGV
jgi:hypothetical protein